MHSEALERIEKQMEELPILQYAVLPTDRICFEERVRMICRDECPQYGSTWSCPPAVGTVEECRQRCQKYANCFVFSTIAEVRDITNMEETLATRQDHEEITRQVVEMFRAEFGDVMALSTESCAICENCCYKENRPCRFPDRMFPCVESHGILVTDLAEMGEMEFNNGANVVTWFSVVFYG
ncbi:MAG: DUF2284 domain-containing protein [Lachnospiraceae bacterium]|nr:DUF2284 domain-containing protein [Lachnospiraceae bacterium]